MNIEPKIAATRWRVTAEWEVRLLVGRLRCKQNLYVISASPRDGALRAGADQVTPKRSLRMQTSEAASSLATHDTRTFGAV